MARSSLGPAPILTASLTSLRPSVVDSAATPLLPYCGSSSAYCGTKPGSKACHEIAREREEMDRKKKTMPRDEWIKLYIEKYGQVPTDF